jgi:hypothetical protein
MVTRSAQGLHLQIRNLAGSQVTLPRSRRVASLDSRNAAGHGCAVPGPIDEFCDALRSELHAKQLKTQSDLDQIRALLADLEQARQAELVASFAARSGLRHAPGPRASTLQLAERVLTAVQSLSELKNTANTQPAIALVAPAAAVAAAAVLPTQEPPPRAPSVPASPSAWPKLALAAENAPIAVVGGSPRPEKLNTILGPLGDRVDWIETSRQGTHAIGNLAQRIRQGRVSALIVLDAAVGHKHSEPLVSAAREVKIPTTYAHKGGAAAVARAFTQLEKMVGAR